MSTRWRDYLTEWFAAYSLLVGITGAAAKLAIILRSLS